MTTALLVQLLVLLIVVAVILWVINAFLPVDLRIKQLFSVLVALIVFIYILKMFALI